MSSLDIAPPSVTLRPWQSQASQSQSLEHIIARISAERGQFRKITEKSVAERLQRERSGAALPGASGDEDAAENEDEEGDAKDIYVAKAEMVKFVS